MGERISKNMLIELFLISGILLLAPLCFPHWFGLVSFRGVELAGEVGEACNVIKKLERERHGWAGSRDIREHLVEELADVIICADLVAMAAEIDLAAAIKDKFNTTSKKIGVDVTL